MPQFETTVFEVGDDLAIELPDAFGIGVDTLVRMEKVGSEIHMKVLTEPNAGERTPPDK